MNSVLKRFPGGGYGRRCLPQTGPAAWPGGSAGRPSRGIAFPSGGVACPSGRIAFPSGRTSAGADRLRNRGGGSGRRGSGGSFAGISRRGGDLRQRGNGSNGCRRREHGWVVPMSDRNCGNCRPLVERGRRARLMDSNGAAIVTEPLENVITARRAACARRARLSFDHSRLGRSCHVG